LFKQFTNQNESETQNQFINIFEAFKPYLNQGSNIESTFNENNLQIHHKVQCDGCGKRPIVGDRFKCNQCEDFDFCSECHKTLVINHPPEHSFTLFVNKTQSNVKEVKNVEEIVLDEVKKDAIEEINLKEDVKKEEIKKEEVIEIKKEEIKEVKKEEIKREEIKKEEIKKEEIKKEEIKKEEIKKEEIKEYSNEDKFKNEIELLKSMGFNNEILNIHLLYKFNGNLEKVVEILLKFK